MYPQALWLGLSVPAILAMYFLRPRRRERVVPSTLLWRPAQVNLTASRPWQRLEKQWLLWLQLAAAGLLALGAAGPVVYWGRPSPSLIVLLDASASMQATDVTPSRFERAKEEVLSLARGLDRGATLTLITFARQPQVVVQQAGDPGKVEQALRGLKPTPFRGNLPPALSLARALAEGQGQARLVLVGDGGYAERIPGEVEFLPVGGQGGNVALAGITLRPVGNGSAVQVAVVNHGGAPAAGRVELATGEEPLAPQAWRLDPGETAYLLWPEVAASALVTARLVVETPGTNALALDDVAWAVPEEAGEARILLVSRGNLFLERALGLIPGGAVYRVSPAQYPSLLSGPYGYELTVLDGLAAPLPPGAVWLVNPPAGEVMPGLAVGEGFRPASLQAEATPVMQHVDLARVRVAAARELKVGGSWTADITAGGKVVAAHGRVDGRPVAVLGFDLSLSDLPLRPAFPVLVHNLVSWLSPPNLGLPAVVAPGEEVVVTPVPQAETVIVRREAPQPEPAGAGQVLSPPFPPAPWVAAAPGVYRVEQGLEGPGEVGKRLSRLVAVNGYDPQEADLTVRLPGKAGEGETAGAASGGSRPRSWPLVAPLAAVVLALSLVEWGVASRGR
ncbi:MAG: vWA domain-containing protein [Moorellales bacterium]